MNDWDEFLDEDYKQTAQAVLPALIQQESGGRNEAVSPKGARGVTQVMPATARDPGFGVRPMQDESEAEYKRFGADYLAALIKRYRGNLRLALAAYNVGPGAVDRAGGIPDIPETQQYVPAVMAGMQGSSQPQPMDWDAFLDESTAPPTEQDQPVVVPRMEDETMMTGIRRGLEKQKIGGLQTLSDIGRFISGEAGTQPSDYRRGLNVRGEELKRASEQAGLPAKLGETALGMVEFGAVPLPHSIPARVGLSALLGGAYAAAQPESEPQRRAWNVARGALANVIIPEGASGVGMGIRGGYRAGRSIVSPTHGAIREMRREIESKLGSGAMATLGVQAPSRLTPPPGGGSRLPPDQFGPPVPRYGYVPGVQPTAGMLTDNPAIRELEQNARLRNQAEFMARDAANKRAAYEALQSRALGDLEATRLQDLLDERTGAMRTTALEAARQNPSDVWAQPVREVVERLRTSPEWRGNTDAQAVAGMAERVLNPRRGGELDPADLYTLRKQIDKMLASKSVAPDRLTAAVKQSTAAAMQIKSAIDEGLERASDNWRAYVSEHAAGMAPISEGRSLQDVLEKFDTAPRIMGTDIPQMSPAALRRGIEKHTYKQRGRQGLVDILAPQTRLAADDVIDVVESVAGAQRGTAGAVAGAPTAAYITGLMKSGLVPGSGKVATVINMLDALGRSVGARELDQALLNPERLQRLLNIYYRPAREAPAALNILRRSMRAIPQTVVNQ